MSVKRRDFLSSTLSLGTGLGLLGVAGCSDSDNTFTPVAPPSDNDGPVTGSTVRIHFSIPELERIDGPLLFATSGKRTPVFAHDEVSLASFAGDGDPSHFVDLEPVSQVTIGWITHTPANSQDGTHEWVHMQLLFPGENAQGSAAITSAATTTFSCDAVTTITSTSSYEDIAVALAFHHPELMSLDTDEANTVACFLRSSVEFEAVVQKLQSLGPATENGGWATLVPTTNTDTGEAFLREESDGNTRKIYNVIPSEELDDTLRPYLTRSINLVKNEATLPNKKYQSNTQSVQSESVSRRTRQLASADTDGFQVESSQPEGHIEHGIQWINSDASLTTGPDGAQQRTITAQIRNYSFRWFSVYAAFLDAEGNLLTRSRFLARETVDSLFSLIDATGAIQDELDRLGMQSYVELQRPVVVYQTMMGAEPNILGIPVAGLAAATELQATLPEEAVAVRFYYGSMGLASQTQDYGGFSAQPLGVIMTSIMQGVVPGVLLSMQLQSAKSDSLMKVFKVPLALGLVKFIGALGGASTNAIDAWVNPSNAEDDWKESGDLLVESLINGFTSFASAIGNALISFVIAGVGSEIDALSEWFATEVTEDEAIDAVPGLGMATKIVGITSTLAVMAQSAAQVANNPPISVTDVSINQRVRVKINHDLDDFQFPATATHYEVTLTLAGGKTQSSGLIAIPDDLSSGTIEHSFTGEKGNGVPSGGTMTVSVAFYSGDDTYVVGKGDAGSYRITPELVNSELRMPLNDSRQPLPLPALPDDVADKLIALGEVTYGDTPALVQALTDVLGTDDASTYRKHIALKAIQKTIPNKLQENGTLTVECTIEEFEARLNADTRFNHDKKLILQSGQRAWQDSAAPTTTLTGLSVDNADGDMSAIVGSTLLQRNGQFAYGWRSAAASLQECGTSIGSQQLYAIQTVSLTDNPQSGWNRALFNGVDCGQQSISAVAFDMLGSTSGIGNHFAVSESTQADGTLAYFVHRVSAAADTPIELSNSPIVGRFSLPPTALSVHPAGYLLSVNSSFHKLEVLPLPTDLSVSFTEDSAPRATPFGGQGSVPGLMNGPSIVRASLRGEIYVLESSSKRIQAFTVTGQPRIPGKWSTSSIGLEDADSLTVLDLGVDATDYLYVLGYTGQGIGPDDYVLDVYSNAGKRLFRESGVAAARMSVDLWRNVYTVNYERLLLADGRAEPSVSLWIPVTNE